MRTSVNPTEYTLEIRFRPNPVILDVRGTWAAALSSHLGLTQWQIVENRVDIFSPDKQDHAFVSFRNAGLVIQNPDTEGYFAGKAHRFLKRLMSFPELESPLFVERIGVRRKQAVACEMSFDALVSQLSRTYLRLAPELEEALSGARLEDLGAPLNWIDATGHFNTVLGPMKEEQFKQFLRPDQKFPPVGAFIDVDYWEMPNRELTAPELLARVGAFATATASRASTLQEVSLAPAHAEA